MTKSHHLSKNEKILIGVTAPVWAPLAFIAYVAITPVVMVAEVVQGVSKTSVYQKRKQVRNSKAPKVASRERSLSFTEELSGKIATLPRVAAVNGEERGEGNRPKNYLMRLPRELRLAIYEEVIGRESVHVMLIEGGKLCSFRCKKKNCHIATYGANHCWIDHYGRPSRMAGYEYRYHASGIGVLPLLQSCRAIYTDFKDVLYSTTNFQLHHYSSLFALTSTILPARFLSIRNLHIDGRCKQYWGYDPDPDKLHFPLGFPSYRSIRHLTTLNPLPTPKSPSETLGAWNLACEVIGQMEGLRMLRIDLDDPEGPDGKNMKGVMDVQTKRLSERFVEPLRELKALELREFRLSFVRDGEAWGWESLPFVKDEEVKEVRRTINGERIRDEDGDIE